MVVYKFGGATTWTRKGLEALVDLTQAAHLKEVARRRHSKRGSVHGVVLVISAIGHTTRQLLRCAEISAEREFHQASELLEKIVLQHTQLAATLHLESELELIVQFQSIARQALALLEGISITRELSLRTRDALLSYGERFATALIEMLLHERGLPVHSIDAREIIVTNDAFGHALPIIEEIDERVEASVLPRLKKSEIVLTQGFIGATREGLTTTMGSESSDLTATLLGASLGAEEVVIWKSVAGIYSADPELVERAKLLKQLRFDEAEEIGRRGARILFPSVAQPLWQKECSTVLRVSSPNVRATNRTTTLQHELRTNLRAEKAVAIVLEPVLLPIVLRHKHPVDEGRELSSTLRRKQDRARKAIQTAAYSWSTALETTLLVHRDERASLLSAIGTETFDLVEENPVSALAVVVRRPTEAEGLVPKNGANSTIETEILRSLRRFKVRSLFRIERSIVLILDQSEGLAALRKLHHDLFEV